MTKFLTDLILKLFGKNAWIGIIILSMIPITELRGTIPFALSGAWGAYSLTWWQAYICAVIGATIPACIIIPLLIPVFNWMKKTKWFSKLANSLDAKFSKHSNSIEGKVEEEGTQAKKERIKFLGVMSFVAVPLPLTGAWTGSAVAAYIKINPLKGILAVFLGNMISGAIMTTLCLLLPNYVDQILNVFLILALVVIVGSIVIHFVKKLKKKDAVALEESTTEEK